MTPTAILLLPIAAIFIGLAVRDVLRDGLGRRRSSSQDLPGELTR